MGRHQAPARHRKKTAGGRLFGALRRPAEQSEESTPPPTPQPPQQPPQQPPAWTPPQEPWAPPVQPPQSPAQQQPAPHYPPPQQPAQEFAPPPWQQPQPTGGPAVRRASWWLLLETGGLALLVMVAGVLLYGAAVVIDGLEVIAGAALLLAPILVRHIALRVHRRWTALFVGYGALLVVAASTLAVGDLVAPHTIAGFAAAALGVLAAGAGFVLASRLFAPKQQTAATPPVAAPMAMPGAAPTPPMAHDPVSAPGFYPAPDESDTDTMPQVIPHADDREDDSLAG